MLGTVAAAVAVIAGVVLSPGSDGDAKRDGAASGAAGPSGRRARGDVLEVSRILASYRVVYEVESFVADARTVTTDVISVRRPFESRIDTLVGAPPGTERQLSVVSAFGYSGRVDDSGRSMALVVRPALAGGDLRFDGVLGVLVEAGRLRPRDRRHVVGRECQVYRSRQPITGPDVEPPAADEHADSCIDAAGLILEDLWEVDGEVIRRRRAVAVDTSPAFDDAAFSVDAEPAVPPRVGEQVTALEPGNRPLSTFWELSAPPDGFEHRGRYAVVVGAPAAPAVTVIDVYTSGPHLVVVEQREEGGAGAGTRRDRSASTVSAGALGRATVTSSVGGTVVEARPLGTEVHVSGTVAAAEVIALAARLQPRDGGEDLRPLPAGAPPPTR